MPVSPGTNDNAFTACSMIKSISAAQQLNGSAQVVAFADDWSRRLRCWTQVQERGEVISFVGNYQASRGQAAALVSYVFFSELVMCFRKPELFKKHCLELLDQSRVSLMNAADESHCRSRLTCPDLYCECLDALHIMHAVSCTFHQTIAGGVCPSIKSAALACAQVSGQRCACA